jgi:acyl-CoA synthetase (NDP forming)
MTSPELTFVVQDADNAAARWRNVFIMVRRGTLTLARQEHVAQAVRAMRRDVNGPFGALFVNLPTSVMPDTDVRERQATLFKDFASDANAHACVVVAGEGVAFTLKRSLIRGLLLTRRVSTFGTVPQAVTALSRLVGVSAVELQNAYNTLAGA